LEIQNRNSLNLSEIGILKKKLKSLFSSLVHKLYRQFLLMNDGEGKGRGNRLRQIYSWLNLNIFLKHLAILSTSLGIFKLEVLI
jgi:hypothetical protein